MSLLASAPLAVVTSPAGTPIGSVYFIDGTVALNPTPIALDQAGHASFPTSSLAQGAHMIRAVFAGNNRFPGSTSAAQTVIVNAVAATTTTALTVSPATATAGDMVTLSAVVTSPAGTPGGSVDFLDGATTLNTNPVALDGAGHATLLIRAKEKSCRVGFCLP
jgi:hypothetical protein